MKKKNCATTGDRTRDHEVKSSALYQLSYNGNCLSEINTQRQTFFCFLMLCCNVPRHQKHREDEEEGVPCALLLACALALIVQDHATPCWSIEAQFV